MLSSILPARKRYDDLLCQPVRHHSADIAAEGSDLPHDAGTDIRELLRSDEHQRFHAAHHPVDPCHLIFRLKVAQRANTADDSLYALLSRAVDQQPAMRDYLHVRKLPARQS